MTSPLGDPWPTTDLDGDGCPVVRVGDQPSMYAKKGIPSEGREDVILKLMEFQYAAIVLMRRAGIEKAKITMQEVMLAKHIGIHADIDDDGGLTIHLLDSMGS